MFSYWEQQWSKQADIVVLGAGLIGLQCAIELKKQYPHRQVWVLDRAPISLGASTRNAGFACMGSAGELLDDFQRIGEEAAIELYAMRYRGLRYLLNHYGATNLGYEASGGYELFTTEEAETSDEIRQQLDVVNDKIKVIHGQQAFFIKGSKNWEMNILPEVIFTPLEGSIHTHLLFQSIRKEAQSLGVQIYGGVLVNKVEAATNGTWKIITKDHFSASAKKLVVCTNGFTKSLFPNMEVYPARGQVIVTEPIADLAWRGLMHANKGYTYFRSLGTRILLGGGRNLALEEEETESLETTNRIQNYLQDYLKNTILPNYPKEIKLEYSWAGTMGTANERFPIIEQQQPGLFFCVRMGGMGVAIGPEVSKKLAELVKAS